MLYTGTEEHVARTSARLSLDLAFDESSFLCARNAGASFLDAPAPMVCGCFPLETTP